MFYINFYNRLVVNMSEFVNDHDGKINTNNCLVLRNNYIDAISLINSNIDKEIINSVPKELVEKYCLIPFKIFKNQIHIAMNDITDIEAIDNVKFITHKNVIAYKSNKEDLLLAINYYYETQDAEKLLKTLEMQNIAQNENRIENQELTNHIKNSPIVKFINFILNSAINMKASDIHMEPYEDVVLIRFRIDGVLSIFKKIPIETYTSMCVRIKVISNLNIVEKRLPQDGKISYKNKEDNYDLRVSIIPTIHGEKIVIRILYKAISNFNLELAKVYSRENIDIDRILESTYGIILITGPTGSGKSTTLYSMLNSLNNADKSIVTIEDPVEYTLFGINQINVNNKSGLTFAKGLRSILRQDPDIIMVGEIRDEETAQIAVRAAITGHLVLSTLHTNDALGSILRLIDMGVPAYLVADSVIAVIAQRLVRKLCTECRVEYIPSEYELKLINGKPGDRLYKKAGCQKCNYTGYKGRTMIFEYVKFDEIQKRMIQKNETKDVLKEYCIKNGMVSLKEDCIKLIKDGITSIDELYRLGYYYKQGKEN